MSAPPPPPQHGEKPRTTASAGSGLPPGKYDIFIIPEHSAGSGFLYLPSLKPEWNSFIAGVACTLAVFVVGQSLAPALRAWWVGFQGIGNMGVFLLMIAVALGAWSLGRQQGDGSGEHDPTCGKNSRSGSGSFPGPGSFEGTDNHYTGAQPPPNSGPAPGSPPPPSHAETPRSERTKNTWQQSQSSPPPEPKSSPGAGAARPGAPKNNTWEKAKEETRRRDEERKAKEAEHKRTEETARRLKEMREREAREREAREEARDRAMREKVRREKEVREKEAREKEAREKERLEKELREKVERELGEKAEKAAKEREEKERQEAREREAREAEERQERLQKEKEEERSSRKGSTYAFTVGEKTSIWPSGRPPASSSHPTPPVSPAAPRAKTAANAAIPSEPPATPTAKPPTGTEGQYSFRPYDKPQTSKQHPPRKKSVSDFSEASWAPSASTAPTTPPPPHRGPYSTKDESKIVIKAVYSFFNQFAKTPASQLISGLGTVTDGLILRITTAGLFVDDDVRGVAQREWDIKAWTLKLIEVWCPAHSLASCETPSSSQPAATAYFLKTQNARRSAERSATKTFLGDDAVAWIGGLGRACQNACRLGLNACAASSSRSFVHTSVKSSHSSSHSNSHDKTGEWKSRGFHLLRAVIRDHEGKRYLFVIGEEESWKIAKGLKMLKEGSQARTLGVAGMSSLETKNVLETLGWIQ